MSADFSLSLKGLMPVPLRDRLQARQSQIWRQEQSWSGEEYIFIQAPSGTGKTTLVHMLYGLRNDFEGSVLWNGNAINSMDTEQLAELRTSPVSVIFQDMRLFPSLTAWENLEIKRQLTDSVTQTDVRAMMEALGVADRADRTAATLSYGEQQRVAIIRALLQPFRWLLMDEPFSHLDHANAGKAAALIASVVQRNNASLLLADLDENNYFPYSQRIVL